MDDILRLARAYDVAARRHAGQRRKGALGEPYIDHLAEVAALVASVAGGDVELVVAAVLHDAVEDTGMTPDELRADFGAGVAALVAEVTDDKSLPADVRKRLQVEHAAGLSDGAKLIKLADKTSNLRGVAASPPVDWTRERRVAYVDWAVAVVAGCRGVSAALEREFDGAVAACRSEEERRPG